MTKVMTIGLSILCLASIRSGARAELVLYVDAATPGSDPANTWQDLSASGYDFTRFGAISHSVENQSYQFFGGNFQGGTTGSESDLDFDTDVGAGEGNGDPLTIVAWLKLGDSNSDGGFMGKGLTTGVLWGVYALGPWDGGAAGQLHLAVNNGGDRVVARWGPGDNRLRNLADGNFHLWVFHADGSGAKGEDDDDVTGLYIDGSLAEAVGDGIVDGLSGSILNDNEVWIGQIEQGNAFNGEIGFIEVWRGELPGGVTAAEYGQARWNGGTPDRGGIVPSTPSIRAAPIFQADYGEVTYLSFESVLDVIYRLEYSLPSDTNIWFETGWKATGNGTTMLSFDPSEPTGSSTDKNYRIRSLD